MEETIRTLREQLRSVKALNDSKILDDVAYAQAAAGLERRLLDAVIEGAEVPAAATAGRRMSTALLAGLMLAAALAGAGIYRAASGPASIAGSDARDRSIASSVPSAVEKNGAGGVSADLIASLQRFTGQSAGSDQAPHAMGSDQIAAMVDGLAKRLEREPDDADGWQMLARSYAVLGRHADALPAFQKALALRGNDPVLLADYADTLAVGQDRRLEGEPLQLAQKALRLDPNQPKALSLVATAAFNRGEFEKAAELWGNLVRTAPADNALREPAQRSLAEARERAASGDRTGAAHPQAKD